MLRILLTALAIPILGSAAPALAAPISVLLIGDSITEGDVSSPVGPSYATLLASSLGEDFEVANAGCGGTSSPHWPADAGPFLCGVRGVQVPNLYGTHALPELPADLVTILLGTNDANGFFLPAPTTAEAYGEAIARLALDLLADGATQVMLLTPPPNYAAVGAQLRLVEYREQILALCQAPGDAILCGPDVFALLAREDFAFGDVHPNGSGHQKIAAALHDAVLGAVPEPSSGALAGLGLALLGLARRARNAG